MAGDLFKGVKQWKVETEGVKAKLPIFYYDNTSLTAIFTASTEKIKELLPEKEMKPLELWPGRCLVAFTAFEYRNTDIDPYNEFSIAFIISFGKPTIPFFSVLKQVIRRHFTVYIWQLPVTTEIARAGGVNVYGYPKFIADIDFFKISNRIRCNLSEKGEPILSLDGRVLATKRGKPSRCTTYSICDGIPLVTNVIIDPIEWAESRKKKAAVLTLGKKHPIAATLSGIELSDNPIMYQYCPFTQAILFGGRNLIDC